MNPLVGDRLLNPKECAKPILSDCLSQVNEDEEQLIFDTRQWTIFVGGIRPFFVRVSIKRLCLNRL